jgi:hypothetical protein
MRTFSFDVREPLVTIPSLLAARRRSNIGMTIAVFLIAPLLVSLLVWSGATVGFSYVLAGMGILFLVALVAWRPVIGFYVVAGSALLIDQSPLVIGGVTLNNFYVFFWPPNLAGLPERPIGFFILLVFIVLICHRFVARRQILGGGKLLAPFLFFLLCVLWGVVHGLTSGGQLKIIVLEVRPLWYLFLSYLLAYNLIDKKDQLRHFFWLVIFSAGVKGAEGTYIYLFILHGDLTNYHEIMAHEESFFFVSLLLLIVLFWMHHNYRPQLYASLLVSPFVIIALIANQRRTDDVALLIGIGVAWCLVFAIKRKARAALATGMLIAVILGAIYVAAFYKTPGSFASPARDIVSVFAPDPNSPDYLSNLYRTFEDYDLKYTVLKNPMGLGFGKPFLEPEVLIDIVTLDPYYQYIPHNTIYWIWMRLGPIGYFALWLLFGSIIVRGSILARKLKDPYLQLIAIYTVSMVFIEIIVAFSDYQLYFYRNVIYIGLLAGILMRLHVLDEKEGKKEQTVHEPSHSVSLPAPATVGS